MRFFRWMRKRLEKKTNERISEKLERRILFDGMPLLAEGIDVLDESSAFANGGQGPLRAVAGDWEITGPSTVNENDTPNYTISYSGTVTSSESVSVDLGLTDIDTTSADYSNFVSAVSSAAAARGDISFDGTTLTYTAPSDFDVTRSTGANFDDITSKTGVTSLGLRDDASANVSIGFDFDKNLADPQALWHAAWTACEQATRAGGNTVVAGQRDPASGQLHATIDLGGTAVGQRVAPGTGKRAQ